MLPSGGPFFRTFKYDNQRSTIWVILQYGSDRRIPDIGSGTESGKKG
jgi:hypothetical protein